MNERSTEMHIKRIIKKKNIKQIDLAKELGISESHISLMLMKKRRMNMDQAYRVSQFMGLTLDELYEALNHPDGYIET